MLLDHILVPLDGSALAECVMPHVIRAAQALELPVTLLHALDNGHGAGQIDPLSWHVQKAEMQAYLNGIGTHLAQRGIESESIVLDGRAAERLVEYTHQVERSLLILSSHGAGGFHIKSLGSVCHKLLHSAQASFLLVRAGEKHQDGLQVVRYRRVLVPLDGSKRAEVVLPLASRLARGWGARLMLAHVVTSPEMVRRGPLPARDVELLERFVERNCVEAGRYLQQVQSQLGMESETRLLNAGSIVAGEIDELSRKEQIDLILLSAHGYTCERGRPFGSVVSNLALYGRAPLLILQDLPADEMGWSLSAAAGRAQPRMPQTIAHADSSPAFADYLEVSGRGA